MLQSGEAMDYNVCKVIFLQSTRETKEYFSNTVDFKTLPDGAALIAGLLGSSTSFNCRIDVVPNRMCV